MHLAHNPRSGGLCKCRCTYCIHYMLSCCIFITVCGYLKLSSYSFLYLIMCLTYFSALSTPQSSVPQHHVGTADTEPSHLSPGPAPGQVPHRPLLAGGRGLRYRARQPPLLPLRGPGRGHLPSALSGQQRLQLLLLLWTGEFPIPRAVSSPQLLREPSSLRGLHDRGDFLFHSVWS